MSGLKLGRYTIESDGPTFFIADIAANHDGDLGRAVDLIHFAAEAGADAAKFQHFRAETIVSRAGFESLGGQLSHQASWKSSVYEVYQAASVPWEWTPRLKQACDDAGIVFFSAAYDLAAVDMLDPFVPAFKIGSGDITWDEILVHTASKQKPLLLATGAANLGEIQHAVGVILAHNPELLLMQCNTNYTGSLENFRFVNLNVLKTYSAMFPDLPLGLSDHTPGHAAVLGAVALGARAIEKHFTDDTTREGPDHPFSLDPAGWREMVERTRELELALGDGNKIVEANEQETVVVQRRCIRAARDLEHDLLLSRSDLEVLRPAPPGSLAPTEIPRLLGKRLRRRLAAGAPLSWTDVDEP